MKKKNTEEDEARQSEVSITDFETHFSENWKRQIDKQEGTGTDQTSFKNNKNN